MPAFLGPVGHVEERGGAALIEQVVKELASLVEVIAEVLLALSRNLVVEDWINIIQLIAAFLSRAFVIIGCLHLIHIAPPDAKNDSNYRCKH